MAKADGRVLRGEATRKVVLRRAVDIASVEGLDGLSLGKLGTELGLSKSGVFAHFGSKEELQLAAIQAATAIFREHVVEPALAVPAGLARITALAGHWLGYSRDRIFPGGCFFMHTSAEFDARSGKVREALAEGSQVWLGVLRHVINEAVELKELRTDVDVELLAFELDALGRTANAVSLLHDTDKPYALAARGMLAHLREAAVRPAEVDRLGISWVIA